jgi:hypothetical protein
MKKFQVILPKKLWQKETDNFSPSFFRIFKILKNWLYLRKYLKIKIEKNDPLIIIYHYMSFLTYHRDMFSLNFLSYLISIITANGKSTIKKDFINHNYSNLMKRVTKNLTKDKELEKNIKQNLRINENNLKSLNDLLNIQLLILKSKKKEFSFKELVILEKFLNPEEINDLKENKFEKANLITLKASYFNIKIYLKILFPELNIDENLKEYFKYLEVLDENKEKNWLKSFFNLKYFSDITIYQKRNIRNIISQKTKLKFKTLIEYLNGKYDINSSIYLYSIYLYIDYLEMLNKELNIEKNAIDEFVKSIISE